MSQEQFTAAVRAGCKQYECTAECYYPSCMEGACGKESLVPALKAALKKFIELSTQPHT